MGVGAQSMAFLVAAKQAGVSYDSFLTLGQQDVYESFFGRTHRADAWFRDVLGAKQVDALDASAYEGATVVHDLNDPVPDELAGRFSAVLDGGTLEHVFNAPRALTNVLGLVAEGGWYLATSPANNQLGHGFFQFSPEFYLRTLTPDNGFDSAVVILCEHRPYRPRWYRVVDPAVAGKRFQLRSRYPVELFVAARKRPGASSGPAMATTAPQQSDYESAWEEGDWTGGVANAGGSWKMRAYERVPLPIVRAVEPVLIARATSWRNGGFQRVTPETAFAGVPVAVE